MPHYYSEKQDSEFRQKKIRRVLLGNSLEFIAGAGMFSKDRVDTGTVILIEHSIIPAESGKSGESGESAESDESSESAESDESTKSGDGRIKILDLGCGYGPVGIAVAKKYPEAKIMMTEVNERALFLTKKNLELNNIKNARCIKSHLFSAMEISAEKFDVILVNPPMSAGRKLCYKIIEESAQHLNPGGTLQLVAVHNKGGEMLSKKMEEAFGNMKTVVKSGGYRVYLSEKTS